MQGLFRPEKRPFVLPRHAAHANTRKEGGRHQGEQKCALNGREGSRAEHAKEVGPAFCDKGEDGDEGGCPDRYPSA